MNETHSEQPELHIRLRRVPFEQSGGVNHSATLLEAAQFIVSNKK